MILPPRPPPDSEDETEDMEFEDVEPPKIKARKRKRVEVKEEKEPPVKRQKTKPSKARSSKYKYVSWHQKSQKWQVQITKAGAKTFTRYKASELEAARLADRVLLEQGRARVNFPEGAKAKEDRPREAIVVKMEEPEAEPPLVLQKESVEKKKAKRKSAFRGVSFVSKRSAKPWKAQISIDGENAYGGYWETELEAAESVDQLLLKRGKERIHFPKLKQESLKHLRRKKKRTSSSKYMGVSWDKRKKKWKVYIISSRGEKKYGGSFLDEEMAGRKADDLYEQHGRERVNFPGEAEAEPQDRPGAVEKAKPKRATGTSRYYGVSWQTSSKKWKVSVCAGGKKVFGGYFSDEEAAGRHADDLYEKGGRERLNFPAVDHDSDAQCQEDVETEYKEHVKSKYKFVYWAKVKQKFKAQISVNGRSKHGGYADDEETAAKMADELLIRYGLPPVNFPQESSSISKTSSFKYVSWHKRSQKWRTQITVGGQVGKVTESFSDEAAAARRADEILADYGRPKVNFPDNAAKENSESETSSEEDSSTESSSEESSSSGSSSEATVSEDGEAEEEGEEAEEGAPGEAEEARPEPAVQEEAAPSARIAKAQRATPPRLRATPKRDKKQKRAAPGGRKSGRAARSSKFKGVTWSARSRKWKVSVYANKKQTYGGYFADEAAAGRKADEILAELGMTRINFPEPKKKKKSGRKAQGQVKRSKYKGVYWRRTASKWWVKVYGNGGFKDGGNFENEDDAGRKADDLYVEYGRPRVNFPPDSNDSPEAFRPAQVHHIFSDSSSSGEETEDEAPVAGGSRPGTPAAGAPASALAAEGARPEPEDSSSDDSFIVIRKDSSKRKFPEKGQVPPKKRMKQHHKTDKISSEDAQDMQIESEELKVDTGTGQSVSKRKPEPNVQDKAMPRNTSTGSSLSRKPPSTTQPRREPAITNPTSPSEKGTAAKPSVAPDRPSVVPDKPRVVPDKPRVVPTKPRVVPAKPRVVPAKPRVVPAKPRVVPAKPRVLPKIIKSKPSVPAKPRVIVMPNGVRLVRSKPKVVPEKSRVAPKRTEAKMPPRKSALQKSGPKGKPKKTQQNEEVCDLTNDGETESEDSDGEITIQKSRWPHVFYNTVNKLWYAKVSGRVLGRFETELDAASKVIACKKAAQERMNLLGEPLLEVDIDSQGAEPAADGLSATTPKHGAPPCTPDGKSARTPWRSPQSSSSSVPTSPEETPLERKAATTNTGNPPPAFRREINWKSLAAAAKQGGAKAHLEGRQEKPQEPAVQSSKEGRKEKSRKPTQSSKPRINPYVIEADSKAPGDKIEIKDELLERLDAEAAKAEKLREQEKGEFIMCHTVSESDRKMGDKIKNKFSFNELEAVAKECEPGQPRWTDNLTYYSQECGVSKEFLKKLLRGFLDYLKNKRRRKADFLIERAQVVE